MLSYQTKKKIEEKWHKDWENSSLFECFDNCEKRVSDWWFSKIDQILLEEKKRKFCSECGDTYTCSCFNPNSSKYKPKKS